MSITLLDGVVKKNRARLIPFMLALYVLAFLDRSNIGFAKETYQIDTGLSNEAYALGPVFSLWFTLSLAYRLTC
ncbi:4-hydroxyphenylacetate permease [Salmonella enterica subsp. enterica]|uniref:4-hydroxyphenylacetate permease n=1 Tax=Salmonella enterica I TaxID=59201 RepID=A0A379W5X2_SALET|nr:4-hydroxyphenylacetate permease [Salmonella enterica subsp. enterica]VEA16193.1 4-hydroxyphenylacetate permease [Salmonella enterica subsp. enterica]